MSDPTAGERTAAGGRGLSVPELIESAQNSLREPCTPNDRMEARRYLRLAALRAGAASPPAGGPREPGEAVVRAALAWAEAEESDDERAELDLVAAITEYRRHVRNQLSAAPRGEAGGPSEAGRDAYLNLTAWFQMWEPTLHPDALLEGKRAIEQVTAALRAAALAPVGEPEPCSECHGSGRTDNHVSGEVECSHCDGSGEAPVGSAGAAEGRTEANGCPCTLVGPCRESCSCADGMMSGGCDRCCRYGSREQRLAAARHLASVGAAPAASGAREQWRPWGEAPQDASWIVAYIPRHGPMTIHHAEDLSGSDQPAFSGWFYARPGVDGFQPIPGTPTHWLPLPRGVPSPVAPPGEEETR